MKTQEEIEKEIVEYYKKYIELDIRKRIKEINKNDYYFDLVKMSFTYIDYKAPITFAPDPVDYVIYSKKQNKVIAIEYPWRQKNGELIYNKIELC